MISWAFKGSQGRCRGSQMSSSGLKGASRSLRWYQETFRGSQGHFRRSSSFSSSIWVYVGPGGFQEYFSRVRLLREPSIVHAVKIGRLRIAGHVTRKTDNNPVNKVLESNPTGTRQRKHNEQDGSIKWSMIYGPFAVTGKERRIETAQALV